MTRTGCDILSGGGFSLPHRARVGLLANQASVSASLEHTADIIAGGSAELTCLFGPQHGPSGLTQANMIEWEGYEHPRLGIPVHSLYGETRIPTPAMLAGLDTVVIDLQDVGARPYTYVWTSLLMMRACAAAGVPVVVLDRPNPIGGAMEGPVLEKGFESFVGLLPLPMRHGLTIGEVLSSANTSEPVPCRLEVVRVDGWKRDMLFRDTGLPWVMPSPNIPSPETALAYAGMVLLEGTNISEGRGTTRPFELAGAPWIDPFRLASALRGSDIPGAAFREASFRPVFDKYAGEDCGGVQIYVTDPGAFRPVLTAVALITAAAGLYPDSFEWLAPPYEYETEKSPIDIIYGSGGLREAVEAGSSARKIAGLWDEGTDRFAASVSGHLLYD